MYAHMMYRCVCVCACVRACVRACMRACVCDLCQSVLHGAVTFMMFCSNVP